MVCGLQMLNLGALSLIRVQNKVLRSVCAIRERKNDQIPVTGTKGMYSRD